MNSKTAVGALSLISWPFTCRVKRFISIVTFTLGLFTASNATIVTVSPNFTNGYMEVFELDGTGGPNYSAFQFGSGWAVSDIKSTVGASSIVLEANYNTYADNAGVSYWRNNGGAGPGGNKWMVASTFAASSATFFTDNVCNFKTEISNYTFTPGYTVRAFIKCFAVDYSSNNILFSDPLTAGSVVDLTLSTTGWANVQYGFEVQGVNANPAASPGSATAVANVVPPPVSAAPTYLFAFFDNNQVALSWADNSNNETGFKIDRKVDDGFWSQYASVASNTTSALDPFVVPGRVYDYRIYAYNNGGNSAFSNTASATPPGGVAPSVTTQSASFVQTTSAQMNASVNPNGYVTSAYFVYGITTFFLLTTEAVSLGNGTTPVPVNWTYSGLPANITIDYCIVARNSGGTTSGEKVAFTTLPLPGPPTITAPGSDTSPGPVLGTLTPTFEWNAVNGATGYGLYIRDLTTDTLIFDNAGGAKIGTSFTLPVGYLSNNGHTYRWAVKSFAESLSSPQSSYRYFSAPESPTPAVKINGVIGFTGRASLNNANLSLATQVVEWETPKVSVIHTGDFAGISTGTAVMLAKPWNLTTAAPGITNFWQVGGFSFDLTSSTRYYDPAGLGFLSASGYGMIKKVGYQDTEGTWTLSTQNPGDGTLFTFSASGAAVPDAGASVASVSPNSVPGSNSLRTFTVTGSNFVSGAQIQVAWGNNSFNWRDTTGEVFINSTTLTVQLNTQTTPDTWRVRVQNPDGQFSAGYATFTVTSSTILPAPTNPSPGSTTSPGPTTASTTVTMSWSASAGAASYGIGVRDMVTNTLVVDTFTTSTSSTASGLVAGRTYRWNVAAVNSAGTSSYTTPLYFTTPGSVPIPPTPTNTSPGSTTSPGPTTASTTVTMSWSASAGAASYGIGVRDMVTNTLVVDTTTTSTSRTVSGLVAGRTYRWNVNATNSAGGSAYTTPLYFTTPASVGTPPGNFVLSNDAPLWDNTLAGPKVTLRWTNSQTAVVYNLYRNNTVVQVSGGAVSPNTDSAGLNGGATYSYFIRAWNAQGTTDSNTVTVTMPTGTAGTSTISDIRASQRAGTKLVDIYYTISGQTTTMTVSLQGSLNGGSSYGLPMNSLSGDVGSGITAGYNRHIVWNAGIDWNNQVSPTVKFRVSISGISSTSSNIAVDTRTGGDLTVTGRVINAQTNLPVAGASVTLAGLSTTSVSNGSFTLVNVNMSGGTTLVVNASGLIQQTKTVTAAAGLMAVNVGDIALAPNTDKPVVEWVKPDLAGLFLYGWNTTTTLRMRVNWNGNTPGQVLVYGKDQLRATLSGAGPEYSTPMPIDSWFIAAGIPGTNHVRVVARTAGASPKEGEKRFDIAVLPIPQAFAAFYVSGNQSVENSILKLKVKFPAPAIKKTVNLPVIGEFGGKLQGEGELEYNIRTGEWKLTIGGVGSSAKIIMGNYDADLGIAAIGRGTATLANGLTFNDLTLKPSFGLSGEFRLGAWGLPDLLGPGLSTTLSKFPFLRPVIDNVVIVVMVKPTLLGSVEFVFLPSFNFNGFDLTGLTALEAFYEPKIMGAKARFYVGGEPSISFQYPEDFFKSVGFRAYCGIKGRAWGLDFTVPEWVFVDYAFASAPGRRLTTGWHDIGDGYLIEAAGNATMESRPMERPWRNTGAETFVVGQSGEELDVFNRMGQAASPGAVYAPAAGPGRRITSDPGLPAQAALPLLTNVFPDAEPALAERAGSLILLYARDNGAANPLQFTEIAWARYDGTVWSTPTALAPGTNGQFAPQVAFDGNGDAIAVWEQINDAAFSTGNLEQLASHMEIMCSRWVSATSTWTTPIPITSNTILDHDPRLAGILPDGDLLLTWIRNAGNKLAGEGTTGAVTNDEVMVARWDSTTGTWGAASSLVPNLTGDTCHSLAVGGNKAVFMWGQDVDGNLANTTDTELFCRVMDASGIWGVTTRQTNDAIPDINARVLVDSTGGVFTVWKHGGDLVMQRDLAGAPSVVRADASSLGATDFSLARGPNGNLLVIWQDMSENGSDAHYRVFDPASGTWGLDTLLSNDRDLERSFAPVWDASGNLVLAYLNVEIVNQTKTVAIAGGGNVTVDGVPQPGRVDLLVARRAIVKDLTLPASGLTAEGTNYLPGDTIMLKAKIKNTGNVAVENVAVSFYNGDPTSGGALIQTVTLPGWLKAYDEAYATINWTIPEPAIARTVFALVDSAGIVTEFDETNNVRFLPLDGVDLQLEYMSGSVLPDGSAQVVAKVKSLSAPESPVAMLKLLRRNDATPLVEVDVSQLAPGDSVEIPLNLPAGSHAEGEQAYRLILDDAAVTGDVDPTNNEVLFNLNLWIDKDGDGLPNQWEVNNGLSDSNPNDGGLDADGDGFTNRQEYLAGTNPRDSSSMLRIGEIAQRSIAQGGGIAISWNSAAGRIYNLERSYDLANWVVIGRNVAATAPLNTVVDHAVAPFGKAFYRLIVLETTDAYNYAPMARTIAFKAERRETEGSINVTLSWDSEIGRTYAVERSTDLINWQVIAEKIPSTLPRNTYTDRAPLSQTKAFYRVLER